MNVQLPGCFRYIQTVLKKFIDRCQCLLIKIIRRFPLENLSDKHLAQRNRELIDQTADTKCRKCNNILFRKENFPYVKRKLRLFIGLGYFLDVADDRTVCNTDLLVLCIFLQHVEHFLRHLLKLFRPVFFCEFFYYNDILLINRSNKIF